MPERAIFFGRWVCRTRSIRERRKEYRAWYSESFNVLMKCHYEICLFRYKSNPEVAENVSLKLNSRHWHVKRLQQTFAKFLRHKFIFFWDSAMSVTFDWHIRLPLAGVCPQHNAWIGTLSPQNCWKVHPRDNTNETARRVVCFFCSAFPL